MALCQLHTFAYQVSGQAAVPPVRPATSELASLVERYAIDRTTLTRRYNVEYSPERYARLTRFYKDWRQELGRIPFASLSGEARIDHVLLSSRLDEGTLARFWGSLNQPVRPAVQAWTAIPILPERLEPFTRVQQRSLEYKNILDPAPVPQKEIGPAAEVAPSNPFNRRIDLGGGGKR